MKDDHEFNIKFVQTVQEYPSLYDFTRSDYRNRERQERDWREVANTVNESVVDCKSRWKNLRASLTRNKRDKALKDPGRKAKKTYYLNEAMQFVLPFTKTRKPLPNSTTSDFTWGTPTTKIEEDSLLSEIEQVVDSSPEEKGSGSDHQMDDPFFREQSNQEEEEEQGYPERSLHLKQKKAKRKHNKERADLHFLKSVLPDMEKMDAGQKNRFKSGVLDLVGRILYDHSVNMNGVGELGSSEPSLGSSIQRI